MSGTASITAEVGIPLPLLHRCPKAVDLVRFAAVAEDFAPQHWDRTYMLSLGFPDVIVHGWLTLTYMCQAVTAAFPPEDWKIQHYEARHKQPALPGPMVCGGELTEVSEGGSEVTLAIWARNAAGDALTVGTMTLKRAD